MSRLNRFLLSLFLLFFCVFSGAIFFIIQRDFLIIYWPFDSQNRDKIIKKTKEHIVLRKKVMLYYPQDDKFFSEEKTIVWFDSKAENLKHLVNNWLSFLHEERVMDKKVYLETVLLSREDEQVFFSFDQVLVGKEWSIFKKWSVIESLFKTIRYAGLDVKNINFLTKNQQMEDDHIDFSQSWPIDGFLQQHS